MRYFCSNYIHKIQVYCIVKCSKSLQGVGKAEEMNRLYVQL